MALVSNLAGDPLPRRASFDLHRGEVLGICGLVGAGRTELLRTIFGLGDVKAGTIRLSLYAGPNSPVKSWLQGMGLLSEDRKKEGLALGMSIADNMTLPDLHEFGTRGLLFPRDSGRPPGCTVEPRVSRADGLRTDAFRQAALVRLAPGLTR